MMNTEPSVVDMGLCTHPEVLAETEWYVQPLDSSIAYFIVAEEDDLLYELEDISRTMKLDWHGTVPELLERAHPEKMWTLTALGGLTS